MIQLRLSTILPGISGSDKIGQKGQFLSSLGIDPLVPDIDTWHKPSSSIRPTQVSKFSASTVDSAPMFMVSNPKDTNLYIYGYNGKVYVVNSSLAMGTTLNSGTALTNASGNGCAYYDNYIYFMKETDVCRYGPLNGSPSLTQNYWSSTLSLTALNNTTYPSINGIELPNHFAFRHTDNALYFFDVLSSNKGCLHKIKTTKTTVEGDTDDGSDHDSLDLLYGWYPLVGCSFGTYVLIAFFEGTSTAIKQKPARLLLWDVVSDSYEDVTIDKNFNEPFITALQPLRDGSVLIFSGSIGGKRVRVDRFYGLNSVQPVKVINGAFPVFPGAVDTYGDRIAFGSGVDYPAEKGCVFGIGSHDPDISLGLHNIIKSSASGANPNVTALNYFDQDDNIHLPITGWKDGSGHGLDKVATTANTSLKVTAYLDNGSNTVDLETISNSRTCRNGARQVEIETSEARGKHDFWLRFTYSNGAIFETERTPINKDFNISKISFSLADVIDASFVGTILLPIDVELDDSL